MHKISVIIPVYNASRFLERCIESVKNQTYDNLEIIIINDGSTDNSAKIAEDMAKKDNRIQVYNKENQGVSKARNFGISKATGDFLAFVDADDTIEKEMYQKLLNCFHKDSEVEISFCKLNDVSNTTKPRLETKLTEGSYNNKNIRAKLIKWMLPDYDTPKYNIMGTCCRSLFKKEFIINKDLSFPYIRMKEDLIFMLQAMFESKKIVVLNEFLYNYTVNLESSSRAYIDNLEEDVLKYEMEVERVLNKYDYLTEKLLIDIKLNSFIFLAKNEIKKIDKNTLKNLKTIRKAINTKNIAIKHRYKLIEKTLTKFNKIFFKFLYYRLYRLCYILIGLKLVVKRIKK